MSSTLLGVRLPNFTSPLSPQWRASGHDCAQLSLRSLFQDASFTCGRRFETLRRSSVKWRRHSDLRSSGSGAESDSSPDSPNCCKDGPEDAVPSQLETVEGERGTQVATSSDSSSYSFESYGPGKRGNQLVALASVAVAIGLFALGRVGGSTPTLPQLASQAISYEEALGNGRPTVLEFYADWCEVCREMAKDVYAVEQEYKDKINFVMLNVDNSKWETELDEFGVEGIPHFSFLDGKGNEEGNIVGRLPKKILVENLAALARGDPTIPHSRVVGKFSDADKRQAPPVVEPRSHSQFS